MRESDPTDVLFEELCDLPEAERGVALERCEDPAVRERVRRLLELFDRPDSPFEQGVRVSAGGGPAAGPPETLGPYSVRSLLGTGGMGAVYLADQHHPQRQVAVKVLQASWLGGERAKRFEREAELLGRLQHPGIAQIFESGRTADGEDAATYIAMEYVDGVPLTEYAERERLGTGERIRLLIDLADAVHHAHLRAVLHRDLKPSNVLVTSDGRVKVIDFGVARALDADGDASLHTLTGQVVGTLAYMSPEQVRGSPDDVDARADVYALGAMAYELFSGRLPLDVRGLTLTAAARVLCETDAPLLGTRTSVCRGDLEQIVARAMEKEPARRYQSAAAFADDLRRYQRHEPVEARPASAIYQIRKVARRHRAVVVGASATLISLLIGAGVAVSYAVRNAELAQRESEARGEADRAAERAEDQAELARANAAQAEESAAEARTMARIAEDRLKIQTEMGRFQAERIARVDLRDMGLSIHRDLLASARERVARGDAGWTAADVERLEALLPALNPVDLARHTLQTSVLEGTREAIDARFADDTYAHIQMLDGHAKLLRSLGLHHEAVETNRVMLQMVREDAPHTDEQVILQTLRLLTSCVELGDYAQASELLALIEDDVDDVFGPTSGTALNVLKNRGLVAVKTGDFARAEVTFREELSRSRQEGHEPEVEAAVMHNLAMSILEQGRIEEAEAIMRDALALVPGPPDPARLHALAVCLLRQGQYDEAGAMLAEAVFGHAEALGDGHPQTLAAKENLAVTLARRERYEEAVGLLEEVLTARQVRPTTESASLVQTELFLADPVLRLGRGERAVELATAAHERARRFLGERHPLTLRAEEARRSSEEAVTGE